MTTHMPGRPRAPRFAQVSVGMLLPARTVHLDRSRLVHYAAASGDRNPIHWDERFATSVGLPDVIAHGMLTMGVAVESVSAWAGAERIVEYRTRFTAPVVVDYVGGADLRVEAGVVDVDPATKRVAVELSVRSAEVAVLGKALVIVDLS